MRVVGPSVLNHSCSLCSVRVVGPSVLNHSCSLCSVRVVGPLVLNHSCSLCSVLVVGPSVLKHSCSLCSVRFVGPSVLNHSCSLLCSVRVVGPSVLTNVRFHDSSLFQVLVMRRHVHVFPWTPDRSPFDKHSLHCQQKRKKRKYHEFAVLSSDVLVRSTGCF